MHNLSIATLATAALLTAGLAYSQAEEAEEKTADSHQEMMDRAGHEEEGPGHAHGGGDHGGGDHGGMGHSNWVSPAAAANRPNPVEASELSLERGEAAYRTNCVLCHGSGARGDGQLAVHLNPAPPDLVIMAPMHPAGDLAWKIETGRGAMPAWQDMLSDTQIWDVVNYLKSLGGGSESGHSEGQGSHGHEAGEQGGVDTDGEGRGTHGH